MNFTSEQRRIANLIGIKNLDSQNDLNQINRAQEGARLAGIKNLDSQNDLRQIKEYYAANPTTPTPTPTPTPSPDPTTPTPTPSPDPTTTPDPVNVGTTGGNSYYEQLLSDLQIQNQTQASNFQNQMQRMQKEQQAAQEQFRRQAMEQQQRFETAQSTTLSNQARGAQQTDTRLGGYSPKVRGGTSGFIRRPRPTERTSKFDTSLNAGAPDVARMPPIGARGVNL